MRIFFTLCALICFQLFNTNVATAQFQTRNSPCSADLNPANLGIGNTVTTLTGDFVNNMSASFETTAAAGVQYFDCPTDQDSAVFAKLTVDPEVSSLTFDFIAGASSVPANLRVTLFTLADPCPADSMSFGETNTGNFSGLFECDLTANTPVDFNLCNLTMTELNNLYVLFAVPTADIGDFEVQVEQFTTPPNDDCLNAIDLGMGSPLSKGGTVGTCSGLPTQTNLNACPGPSYTAACYSDFSTGSTVWYTFTTGTDVNHISVEVDHTNNGDVSIALVNLPGGCGPPPTRQPFISSIDDDYCEFITNGADSLTQLPVIPNTTYYILVNTPSPDAGDFDICVSSCGGPTNDDVCNADLVVFDTDPNNNVTRTGNTNCASIFWVDYTLLQSANFSCAGPSGADDPLSAVFYELDIDPNATRIQISASNFSGSNNLAGQIFLLDNEGECPGPPFSPSPYMQPISGSCDFINNMLTLDLCNIDPTDYEDLYLFVGSERNDQGSFDLSFNQEIAPPNDLCDDPSDPTRGPEPIGDANSLPSAAPILTTGTTLCETAAGSPMTATTRGACPDPIASDPCFSDFNNEATVWYTFQTDNDVELITTRVQHSNSTNTRIALFELPSGCGNAPEGSYPPAMLSEYCGADPSGFVELENLPVRANTTYYIAISTGTIDWGEITEVCVEACQPPNNDFPCNATVIPMANPSGTNLDVPFVVNNGSYPGEATTVCANPIYTDDELNTINASQVCDPYYSTVFYKLDVDDYATKIRVVGTAVTPGILLSGQFVRFTDPCAARPSTYGGVYLDQMGQNNRSCDLTAADATIDLCGFTQDEKDSLYFMVSTERLNQGEFELEIFQEVAPPNDLCEDLTDPSRGPEDLGVLNVGSSVCGTELRNRGSCGDPALMPPCFDGFVDEASIWFEFQTGPDVEFISAVAEHQTASNVRIALFRLPNGCGMEGETSVPAMVDEFCSDGPGNNGLDSVWNLTVRPNQTYYVVVSTDISEWGEFQEVCINACAPPGNDQVCDVIGNPSYALTPGEETATDRAPSFYTGTTVCANPWYLDETGTVQLTGCPNGESTVFYKIDLNDNATELTVTASKIDPVATLSGGLFIPRNTTCPSRGLTAVPWTNPDGTLMRECDLSANALQLQLCGLSLEQRDSVYLFVQTERKDQGKFELQVSQKVAPENDECSNATVLPASTDAPLNCVVGTNLFACPDDINLTEDPDDNLDENCILNNPPMANNAGVWFEFTTDAFGELLDLTVSHTSQQDVNVAIYAKNPDCGNLQPFFCEQGSNGIMDSIKNYLINPDTTYLIYVYTDTMIAGEFEVCYDVNALPECEGDAPRYFNQTTPICGFFELENYCLNMTNMPAYVDDPWPGCGVTLHDPNWFTFVAGADELSIEIAISACQDGAGVQIEMYELPCEVELGPGEDPLDPTSGNLGAPIAGCQYANSPQIGTVLFEANTIQGNLYGVVIDGWSQDLCFVEVLDIIEGGDPPNLDGSTLDPPTFPDGGFGFDSDTICAGAVDVPFGLAGEVDGACRYIWTLNGDEIPGSENSFEELIDFPMPGEYEICVAASNICDTTAPICDTVVVVGLDPYETVDTICQGEPYEWYGPFGNLLEEYPPFNNQTGDILRTSTAMNSYMCQVPAELNLFVINENEEDPIPIDTFACFPASISIKDTTFTGPVDDYEVVKRNSNAPVCDSFFSLNLIVFGGTYFYNDPICDGMGNMVFSFSPMNDPEFHTNWFDQFEIFETNPDFELEIQWKADGFDTILGNELELTLSQELIEQLAINGEMLLRLNFIMRYKGEIFCQPDALPLTFILEHHFPEILNILGDTTYCPGQQSLRFFSEVRDPLAPTFPDPVTFYRWYPPNGFTVESPYTVNTDTIELTSPPAPDDNTLCLTVTTGSCMFTDSLCIELRTDLPDTPFLEPPNQTCGRSWTFSPSVASSGGWTIIDTPPSGNTATFNSTSSPTATVTVTEPGSYTFQWREGPMDCALYDTVTIDFLENPEISVTDTCYFGINYVATAEFNGGTGPYTILEPYTTIDGDLNGNIFTSDTIEIDFDLNTGNFGDSLYLAVEDANGCRDSVLIRLLCQCDSEIGDMATDTIEVCEDDVATATYLGGHNNDGDDTLNFILHEGDTNSLINILDTSLNGEFTFDPSSMTYGQTYYVSMVIGNAVGQYVNLSDPCLDIAAGQPVIWYENPVADAGQDTTVCGFEYILNANPSVGTGSWEVIPANPDVTITNPTSPNAIATVIDPGTYTFRWTENNEGCTDSDEVDVELTGEIEWVIYTPCNATNDSFSIEIVLTGGGGNYFLVSGPGSLVGDTIKVVSLPKESFVSFVVNNDLGCGPVDISDVGTTCICETEVGTLQTDTILQACNDGCIDATLLDYDTTGQFLDPNDVISYVLHRSPGDTLLDANFIAQSPTGEFCYSDFASQLALSNDTAYVSVIIGNRTTGDNVNWRSDPCFEITFGAKVVFDERPVADAGVDTAFCFFTGSLSANPSIGDGNWRFIDGPSTNVTIGAASNASTTVDVDTFGTYSFEWSEDNQGCTDADTVDITFLSSPEAVIVDTICDNLASSYTITFEIVGGDPSSYGVTGTVGGTLSGATFTSNAIPHDSSYTFFVFDANGCDTFEVTGSHFCPCITEIGTLTGEPLDLCRDEVVSGISYDPTGETRDGNDGLIYVLLDASGNIISERNNPAFFFDPGSMTLGETYSVRVYLGSIIGGVFQYDERCTLSDGDIDVTWHGYVEAMAEPAFDTLTCDLTSVNIDGSISVGVGNGLNYSWSASNGGTIDGPTDGSSITATSPGDYTLTVTDPLSGCTDEVTVTIERSADIPVAEVEAVEPSTLTCDVTEVTIDGSASSSGPDIEYAWTGSGNIVGPTDGNTIVVDQAGTYTLTVTDISNSCSSMTSIEIFVDREPPVAQATVSDQLSCSVTQVDLLGSGSSTGSDFIYEWSTNNGDVTGSSNALNTTADSVGDYTLVVTNTENGCVDSTTVSVTRNPNALTAIDVEANDPRCHNEVNGNISVTPTGGEQPITYTLVGVEENNTGSFTNLGPGTYTIEVTDVNGCFETETVTLVNPPLLSIDITESVIIEEGDSVIIEAILPPGAIYDTLIWDTDTVPYVCLDSACTVIELRPLNTVEVIASVIGGVGCSDEDAMRIVVRVVRDIYIPNVFTPNGDGLNDVFLPAAGRRVVSINNMQVYDRWGSLIFESRNFLPGEEEFGWDGTFRGEELQPAVFVYKVEVEYDNGDIDVLNGTITLSR